MPSENPHGSEEPRVNEFGRGGRISGGPEPDLASGPRKKNANLPLIIAGVAVGVLLVLLVFAFVR